MVTELLSLLEQLTAELETDKGEIELLPLLEELTTKVDEGD